MRKITATPLEIAQERSLPEPNTGCWLWTGPIRGRGYAALGRNRYLTRELLGISSRDLVACHRCDTPSCVNPDHLFVGTRLDNAADMVKKGRWVYGEKPQSLPKKTHCVRGHPFDDANTRLTKAKSRNGTGRACRACMAMHQRAWKARAS